MLCAMIPHGVKCKVRGQRKKYYLNGVRWNKAVIVDSSSVTHYAELHNLILLLRPLSQLAETIEHNGDRLCPIDVIKNETGVDASILPDVFIEALPKVSYNIVKMLHSWHFDTFGLIEAGLAEPIPSIPHWQRTQHIHNLLLSGSYTICELQTHVTKKMNRSRRWSVSAIQTSINEIPNAVKDGASWTIVP